MSTTPSNPAPPLPLPQSAQPLLRDAVRAIKQKIVAAASSATPEELAYLGTAIDRIGGRATVLEVEDMGDVKMAHLSAHAQSVHDTAIAQIEHVRSSSAQSMERTSLEGIASLHAARDAAITATHTHRDQAIASTTQARDQAIAAASAHRDQVLASSEQFRTRALAEVAAAAQSVTQQLVFGARGYFYAQM